MATGGRVAVQQALRFTFRQPYRKIAKLMNVSPRTVWEHCQAAKGSNVRPWSKRSESERAAAEFIASQVLDSAKLKEKSGGPKMARKRRSSARKHTAGSTGVIKNVKYPLDNTKPFINKVQTIL